LWRLGWPNNGHSGNFVAVFIDGTDGEAVVLVSALGKLSGDYGSVKPRRPNVWQDSARFVFERLAVAGDMKEVPQSQSLCYRYRNGRFLIIFPT
jgi:hypothetical protein